MLLTPGLLPLTSAAAAAGVWPIDVPGEADPSFQAFPSRDGLTDEIWNAVGVGAEGFVWAGAASPLARFDGYRWVAWPIRRVSGLVHGLERDARGRLWSSIGGRAFVRLENGAWRHESRLETPVHQYVHPTSPAGEA